MEGHCGGSLSCVSCFERGDLRKPLIASSATGNDLSTPQRSDVKAVAWRLLPVATAPSLSESGHALCVTAGWSGGSMTTLSSNAWCAILSSRLFRKVLTMFRFSLYLAGTRLEGIEALDYRRSMKLEDDVILHVPSYSWTFDVTEEFARLHFPSNECCPTARVPLTVLEPGGLVDDVGTGSTIKQSFTQSRAESLFLEFYRRKGVSCSG